LLLGNPMIRLLATYLMTNPGNERKKDDIKWVSADCDDKMGVRGL
jgi:hypothetical protein